MKNEYRSLKLDWGQVSLLIDQMASAILHRTVRCRSSRDDYDFWSVNLIDGRFTADELKALLDAVCADGEMRRATLGMDTSDTPLLDMDLSRALLLKKLQTNCMAECPCEDGLWLMGVESEALCLPEPDKEIIFIDGMAVDLRILWPKDEFIDMLFERGGTVGALSETCNRYVHLYRNELYWSYPITDGEHNGVYFVLVREGVLCLPYNEIDPDCFEIFEKDAIRLLTAEDMRWFISDWERMSHLLMTAMTSMEKHLEEVERYAA